jgi:hypothetical protein
MGQGGSIRTTGFRSSAAALLAALLAAGTASIARAEPPPDEGSWDFQITPYFWIPATTGSLTIAGVEVPIDTSVADLFTETDFVFGLWAVGEAWYQRRWGILFNGQWTVLEKDDIVITAPVPPLFPTAQFDLTMNLGIFELAGAYDFGERSFGSASGGPTWQVQPLVGARATVLRSSLEFLNGRKNSVTKAWADPILGARGRIRFGNDNRWSWVMRGDLGGFGAGSDFTWNAVGMLGYDFHIRSVASTVVLGARALYQDFEDGAFRWDVTQYGPLLGLAFHF